MKHSTSGVNKKDNIKIIFDGVPDIDEGVFVRDLIHWQPLYDLYVVGNDVIVTIEIAGVNINDFSIYVRSSHMIIDGIRRSPDVLNKEYCTFHNLEISYGRFIRRIDFPVPIEPRRYQSKIENGILTLKFPILKERIIPIEEA